MPGAAWSRGDDPQRGRAMGKGKSLKNASTLKTELLTTIQSWEAIPPDTAAFTPDISPLILAAHTDNYEIIKILLDRGAVLPCPHHQRYQALLPSPHHQRLRIRVLTTSRDPSSSSSSSLLFVLLRLVNIWGPRKLDDNSKRLVRFDSNRPTPPFLTLTSQLNKLWNYLIIQPYMITFIPTFECVC